MAAVTQNSPSIDPKVAGNFKVQFYNITVVTTADTLSVAGMTQIYFAATNNPAAITNIAISGTTLTFTGTVTAASLVVMGN
jgi:hypothetical protein